MTLIPPQNILLKIDSTQDNIEYQKKSNNTLLKPFFIHNSSILPINTNFFLNNQNNTLKEDTSNLSEIKNNNIFQINPNQQIKSNFRITNINNTLNSTEDIISFKTNNDSLFNLESLNNSTIKNRTVNSTKLIKPQFYKESNIKINSKTKTNKPLSNINNNALSLKVKQNVKYKGKKIFNKFKISHIETKNKLSINKLKHKRKYKPDDIRKKIKARFHKSIKNIINENLKRAGSKHFFSFLPQIFISSIARDTNHQVLNLTYRELLQKDFVSDIDDNKYKNKKVDFSKYKNNLNVLDYLDKNPEICQNSGFDLISKMKYCDLLEEYFKSDEFDKAIYKLKMENEEQDYINEYINKAKSYVSFFSEVSFKIKGNKGNKGNKNKDAINDKDKVNCEEKNNNNDNEK